MANSSPSSLVKQIETQVNLIMRKTDLSLTNEKGRKAITELRQNLSDAKIYTNDYELSEMRDEQVKNASRAKKYLDQARQHILRASEFNIFGAIDVAHLTAQIDQAKADLK